MKNLNMRLRLVVDVMINDEKKAKLDSDYSDISYFFSQGIERDDDEIKVFSLDVKIFDEKNKSVSTLFEMTQDEVKKISRMATFIEQMYGLQDENFTLVNRLCKEAGIDEIQKAG